MNTVAGGAGLGPARLYLSCPRISPAPSPARSDPADPAVLGLIVRMAVLVEGQKFALSSKSQTSKSVVYVKLTDSALRSLEDYLKNKVRILVLFRGLSGP